MENVEDLKEEADGEKSYDPKTSIGASINESTTSPLLTTPESQEQNGNATDMGVLSERADLPEPEQQASPTHNGNTAASGAKLKGYALPLGLAIGALGIGYAISKKFGTQGVSSI